MVDKNTKDELNTELEINKQVNEETIELASETGLESQSATTQVSSVEEKVTEKTDQVSEVLVADIDSKSIESDLASTSEEKQEKIEQVTKAKLDGNIVQDWAQRNAKQFSAEDKSADESISFTTNQNEPLHQQIYRPRRRPFLGFMFKSTVILILLAGIGLGVFYGNRVLDENQILRDRLEAVIQEKEKSDGQSTVDKTENSSATAVRNIASNGESLSTAEIAKRATPAVVAIKTKIDIDSIFGRETLRGSGSGVLIDPKGYIVTNNHVVEGNDEIKVQLSSDTELPAELIASDPTSDLAVLKIKSKDGKDFPFIKLADSDKVVIGEKAIAIGNPLGRLDGTVTQGIISAINREVYTKSSRYGKGTRLEGILQTDASINEGNSGGALLNDRAELIGINTAKASSRDGVGVEGIGFAIPSNIVKRITDELLTNGYVSGRPEIGIRVSDISEANARAFSMPVGVLVVDVNKDSAAEQAGLNKYDIITKFNGKAISTVNDLNLLKNQYKAGDKVKLTVWRQGETNELELTLGEQKPQPKKDKADDKNTVKEDNKSDDKVDKSNSPKTEETKDDSDKQDDKGNAKKDEADSDKAKTAATNSTYLN